MTADNNETIPFTIVQTFAETALADYHLIFGKPKNKRIYSSAQREYTLHSFTPGSLFALDLRKKSSYGITDWVVYVLQAARPGETIVPVPQVSPGAKVLLEAHGKTQALAALQELEELQKLVDPTTLPAGRFLLTDFRLKANTRYPKRKI